MTPIYNYKYLRKLKKPLWNQNKLKKDHQRWTGGLDKTGDLTDSGSVISYNPVY